MSQQNIKSDLIQDISTEEQQLLSGGRWGGGRWGGGHWGGGSWGGGPWGRRGHWGHHGHRWY